MDSDELRENIMRFITWVIAFVAMVGLVTSIGSDAMAQNQRKQQQQAYAQDRGQNPQSFDACVVLAKQRGYSASQTDYRARARAFVQDCMNGKQR
jgi:hypothetical protein